MTADWSPPCGTDIRLVPAGRWWDAVKVPRAVGDFALKLLALDTGAVIEDAFSAHLYWLVPVDSATGWRLPYVTVLGAACYLAVPPGHRTEGLGVHWRVPCEPGHTLTDPAHLREALETAIDTLST